VCGTFHYALLSSFSHVFIHPFILSFAAFHIYIQSFIRSFTSFVHKGDTPHCSSLSAVASWVCALLGGGTAGKAPAPFIACTDWCCLRLGAAWRVQSISCLVLRAQLPPLCEIVAGVWLAPLACLLACLLGWLLAWRAQSISCETR
jgi:hypothetical protein